MRTLLAAILALTVATPAAAWNEADCGRRPPMRYLHEPVQPYTIEVLSWDALQARCSHGFALAVPTVWACADTENSRIYIFDGIPARMHDCALRHEKAHLNGWSYFHEIR